MDEMNTAPEVLLAIECTRSGESAESAARIRERIQTGVSWMKLIQFAIVHGIFPLVANTLKITSSDLLPSDVLFQFDRALARAQTRNLRQWAALSGIMNTFAEEGVRLLAFKGAALTAFAYNDLRLRESFDVDLWAAREDTGKAGEILGSIGYRPVLYRKGKSFGDDSSMQLSEKDGMHGEFYNADLDVAVDLQNIQPQFFFTPDFDVLWEERCMAAGPERSVPTLSKENYLLALAVHGEKHRWGRLNWMVDVDRILASSTDFDWDAVFARAERWRCHRRLCSTLAIRSRLYHVPPLNRDVARYLTDATTERIAASFMRLDVSSRPPTLRTRIDSFSGHYALIDRPGDRARYTVRRIMGQVLSVPSKLRRRSERKTEPA